MNLCIIFMFSLLGDILDMLYVNFDVYIFLRFVVIFSEFFNPLCSVSRVSPKSGPRCRDRCGTVPAESAAENATLSHDSYSRLD